jgi:hypothetical protein
VQFGQTSGFGNARPAFGTSTFGATPTLSPAASATSTPVSEAPPPKPLPSTGGFAGFSTPSKLTGSGGAPPSSGFASFGTAKASAFGASAGPAKSVFSTSPEEDSKPATSFATPDAVQTETSPAPEAGGHDDHASPAPEVEDHDNQDDQTASPRSEEGLAPEILEDEAPAPEETDPSFATDHEGDVTYSDSEEEEEAAADHDEPQERPQEDELSASSTSTSDSSSPVLVERPEDPPVSEDDSGAADTVADDSADVSTVADITTDSPIRGHSRKPSKVHAAAQEWENLASGSDTAEPVKNSPTKFSFDIPATSTPAKPSSSGQPAATKSPQVNVPNFFGIQSTSASATAVPKPASPFSFGSPPTKPTEGQKAAFAGVGVQPPSSSSLNAKPNAFGFRTPTTAPARSSPLTNASLPLSESQENEDRGTQDSVSITQKSSKMPLTESPFSSTSGLDVSGVKEEKTAEIDAVTDKPTTKSETPSPAAEPQHGLTRAFSDAYHYLEEELRSVRDPHVLPRCGLN